MSSAILQAAGIHGAATHRNPAPCRFRRLSISLSMKDVSAFYQTWKMEDNSRKKHQKPDFSKIPELGYARPLPLDEEIDCEHKWEFGPFTARPAVFHEEFWVAAWLWAETYWEDEPREYYDWQSKTYKKKKKFADQEFSALKKRCAAISGEQSTLLLALKKYHRPNIRRIAVNSIVGTLEFSTRYLLPEETFPQVRTKANVCASTDQTGGRRYGYLSNLCVWRSLRRHGIASNIVHLAIQVAKSSSVEQVFVHVPKDNVPAQQLFKKIGFEMVEMAMTPSSKEENYLLSYNV